MAWGRGGAGNIEAMEAEQSKRVADDIESQHRRASRTGSIVPIRTTTSPPAPYAHSGRGGAGNTFSPAELAQTGTFTSTATEQPPASSAASGKVREAATATAEPPPRDLSNLDTQSHWYNTATRGGAASPQNPTSADGNANANAASTPPSNPPNTTTAATSTVPPPEIPIARTGRGGAGNFVWSSSPNKNNTSSSAAATADQAAQLQRSVLADVEKGLARPGRAWLGPGPGSPPPAAATANAVNGEGGAEANGTTAGTATTSPPRKVAARKGSWERRWIGRHQSRGSNGGSHGHRRLRSSSLNGEAADDEHDPDDADRRLEQEIRELMGMSGGAVGGERTSKVLIGSGVGPGMGLGGLGEGWRESMGMSNGTSKTPAAANAVKSEEEKMNGHGEGAKMNGVANGDGSVMA
ncbi:hypothetical protein IWZ01DRAFT_478415 [Phyllosticta capitalensis]|uniref:Uncharacterized protein n=1 Tax=Phyllosticta capitalensis TaxID=121624 RepID=A0ABR1Z1K6_9PEZI